MQQFLISDEQRQALISVFATDKSVQIVDLLRSLTPVKDLKEENSQESN